MIRDGLWNGFKAFLRFIFGLFSASEGEPIIEKTPPQGQIDLSDLEPKEPSAIAKYIEMITMYIAYVMFFVIALVIIFLIIKKTRMWMKQIVRAFILFIKRIINRVNKQDETAVEYIDEKESIFEWNDWINARKK